MGPAESHRRAFEMAIERWSPFVSVERWDPFRSMSDMPGEVDRLFDSFLGRPAASVPRTWAPVLDIHETKDELVLSFELPGVTDKDVSLSITGDLLTLKGERAANRDVKDENVYRVERVYGKFERSVQLPMPVQADKVKATYRDGVLEVKLPKVEEVKPKAIKIDII
jgi:HSP20 family protein